MTDFKKTLEHSTSVRFENLESDIHFLPMDDWFEHLPDVNCPCLPILDTNDKGSKNVWVHNRIKESEMLI
jgi:hypothetical protein